MEGTRRPLADGGAGRLCSRVMSAGTSACPNRPRRARERLGRLHAADWRRKLDRHQPDAAWKDSFIFVGPSGPDGGRYVLRGIESTRFQRLHPYQPRRAKIHNSDINERFAHGDACPMDSPYTPVVLH